MPKVVRFHEFGGPDVLRLEESVQVSPGPGEVWLEHEAIGVNYLDATQRKGGVPVPLPSGLGLEAAGVVQEVGSGISNVRVGDRVAYALGAIGAYSSGRVYPVERLVQIPKGISCGEAAAVLFKGLTAHYLITSTYPVKAGDTVLLYGAAGGVGQLVASWATHLGARVIGVVSRPEDILRAQAVGCSDALVWSHDLPAQVASLTSNRLVDVVYDGVGKKTFDASIASLRPRGMMVSIGASSGIPDPVAIPTLNAKSLFLTRPGLAAHAGNAVEYQERARAVFDAVSKQVIHPAVSKIFPLAQAADAHRQLEMGGNNGSLVLVP